MSEFASQGFKPFPNTHSDAQEVTKVAEWSDSQLEYKTNEYGQFLQREDIMQRARTMGTFVLDRLIFELAYRDGVYNPNLQKVEDGLCEAS